jgi:predicted phage tail protein|tara:strand:- start:11561 stop:12457 length:897 start_codon:yes stop_codon:yes gene_type:complete
MANIAKQKDAPFKFLGKIFGGIYSGIQAGKANKKAEKAAAETKAEMDRMKEIYSNLDTSNPFEDMTNQFAGMENKMEDLTINQKEAEMANQQFAQSQANIMSGLRGSAGSSGIAALAQTMAQQGQLAAQKSAAGIGQQEAANQAKTASAAANIQLKERSGAAEVANKIAQGEQHSQTQEMNKQKALLDMANAENQTAQQQVADTQAAKDDAWSGVIGGVGDLAGNLLGSDRRLKKNIKLIGKSPSGLKIYIFEYIDKFFGDGIYQGVMSDEIPNNAIVNNGGYDRVDYSKLDVEFKKL